MMFVRRPFTHSLFEPAIGSPSISYLVLQPGSENDEANTSVATSKQDNTTKTKTEPTKTEKPVTKPAANPWPILLDDFEILEEEGHVVLSTELPGIKHADLQVQFEDGALHVEGSRMRGNKKQSFIRRLAMDEDALDIENLAAKLEDGILTVKAPKAKKVEEKEGEARKVIASKSVPPEDPIELNMEIDMPGVKVDDLEIVLAKNGTMSVYGERKNGKSQPSKRAEAYMLNTRKVDTSKLEAYLNDGVLTIRAPAKVHKVKTVAVNGQLPPLLKEPEKKEVSEEKKE